MSRENNSVNPRSGSESSELVLRLISAAVGLPLLGLALYFGFWPVSVIAIGVAAIVGLETRRMAYGRSDSFTIREAIAMFAGAVVAGVGVFSAAMAELDIDVSIATSTATAIGVVIALLLIEIVIASRFKKVDAVRRNLTLSYGAFAVLAVTMLPYILTADKGRELLTFGILVVFAADTGAYFVGRAFGKRKMAPNVSPGKTWEGFAGGVVAVLIATWALSNLLSLDFSVVIIASIGAAIVVLGVAGDLGESWIKRLSGVKDSGGIIPGHGGLMDRLDALAPNFVFIYFIDRWLV